MYRAEGTSRRQYVIQCLLVCYGCLHDHTIIQFAQAALVVPRNGATVYAGSSCIHSTIKTFVMSEKNVNQQDMHSINRREWLGIVISSSAATSILVAGGGAHAVAEYPAISSSSSTTTTTLASNSGDNDDATAAPTIPMITYEELEKLFLASARSIQVVEFSGPNSEVVTVKLLDGKTRFGVSNIVESSTDPRSPLRVAALCREFKIPTKFITLEAILMKSGGGTAKRKLYTNERVREALIKEKEKKERIAQDETDRLAELYQYQQQVKEEF